MKTLRTRHILLLLLLTTLSVSAQQVSTLYFLENAPMRHTLNPAFQPVSQGYVTLSPLGFTSLTMGNDHLTLSDMVYRQDGALITSFHPQGNKQALMDLLPEQTRFRYNADMSLFNMGKRLSERSYMHVGIMLKSEGTLGVPRNVFDFLLNGGMHSDDDRYQLDLSDMSIASTNFLELSGGYSFRLDNQWTVGGKAKVLIAANYATINNQSAFIYADRNSWQLDFGHHGEAGRTVTTDEMLDRAFSPSSLKPCGGGAAIDFGMVYRPCSWFQLDAAINDLGFLYWKDNTSYSAAVDTSFHGVDAVRYSDYVVDGVFQEDAFWDAYGDNLGAAFRAIHFREHSEKMLRMTSMKLNIGFQFRLWQERISLGVMSHTVMRDMALREELTLGASLQPWSWLSLAATYSVLHNGKYSNLGAGLSIMPYDGINLTLAADYIPTAYAIDSESGWIMPYTSSGLNLTLGFAVVWGTNHNNRRTTQLFKKKANNKDIQ